MGSISRSFALRSIAAPNSHHGHLPPDTLKLRRDRLGPKFRQQRLDPRIVPHLLGHADLLRVGHRLHPGGDVHRLAEIVELVVEGDGDRRAVVDADLECHRAVGLALVEALGGGAHLQRGGEARAASG